MHGYHGQYLSIDLTQGTAAARPLPEPVLRSYLGGSGLGVWLLHALGGPTCDPLSPAAPLAFVFSPLVGSPLTTSAKFAVVSKSPLTERINDSLASSAFALAGKRTGCDALVLTGAAAELSVALIEDGRLELLPAADLRGLSCSATEARLKARLGPDWALAVIGPAGEALVRYATVSHDGRHAGRGGSGAVLGAKRIKALALRGSHRCTWAHPAELVAASRDLSARSFGPATAKYRELGTAANLLLFNRLHALPTRNFQQGSFELAPELSVEQLQATREKTRTSCAACTIGCEHLYALRDAGGGPPQQVRLEYENLFALGSLCGISDAETVLRANRLCDELGLDTISAGGTLAWAMECGERGLLDVGDLRFGAGPALLAMLEQIAHREGLGDLLAEGTRRAAARLGPAAAELAVHVKGLELPGYEPRSLQTMALGFAVGARGADHNRSGAYEADFSAQFDRHAPSHEAVRAAVETEDRAAVIDSLILCKFLRGVFHDFWAEASALLRLVTGWECDAAELRATARRIVAAKKLFNVRAGWQPHEDRLPDRFFDQPLPEDGAQLDRARFAQLVAAYNAERGWSAEGWPPESAGSDLLPPPRQAIDF